ncbi:MAG: hypothetical protein ACYS26_19380, partial [Planctomycetota bacterium]
GHGRLRIGAVDRDTGERIPARATLIVAGEERDLGVTRDERYDTNDMIEVVLPHDQEVEVRLSYGTTRSFQKLTLNGPEHLHMAVLDVQLTRELAQQEIERALAEGADRRAQQARERLETNALTLGAVEMPIWWKTFGEEPEGGHSLWISMHGGGGAPAQVNTQQWENQKRLYQLEEGIYVAPRAPTNTWNLWHQGHIDALFDQLIATRSTSWATPRVATACTNSPRAWRTAGRQPR